MESAMPWTEIFLSLMRCELKARSDHFGGWQTSAKGALSIILLILCALVLEHFAFT
jgi:hypothetical protein